MTLTRKLLTTLALVAGLALANRADAAPINGTLGYVPIGETTIDAGTTVGTTNTLTVPGTLIINSLPALYLGSPNDFVGLVSLGDAVTQSPLSLDVSAGPGGDIAGVPFNNFVVFGPGGRFEFDLTSGTLSSTGALNLGYYGTGMIHDTLGIFDDQIASLSFAATQDGIGSAVNISFTLSTPPAPRGVPEPGTVAMALTAFAGLGLVRVLRKRTK